MRTSTLSSLTLSAALFIVAFGAPAIASAQSSDDERARLHFESARVHYEEGAYDRALQAFESAFALSARPMLLVNMANCLERLGRPAEAAARVREYLAAVPDVPDRARFERRIQNLDRLAARERPQPVEAEPDAKEGAEPDLDVSAGADLRGSPEGLADVAPSPRGPLFVGALTSYGVALGGLAMFVTAGPMALREDRALAGGCGALPACAPSEVARADRLALVADVGLGVLVAGAAVGTVMLLVDKKRRTRPALEASPYASTGGAGFVLRGLF